jgi:uncharacterized RDD family membrane protein YckC
MQGRSTSHRAPRLLRAAAFSLDVMLGILVAVSLRLLVRLGVLPELGSWSAADTGAAVDIQLVALVLTLVALRDVPFGSSLAKWLLCLRLVRPDGQRLSAWQRLLRAPLSLPPIAMLPGLPWNVVAYAPGRPGLFLRTALTGCAATFSLAWAVETIRPSIGRNDAERLSLLILQDPLLHRDLGAPLVHELGEVTPRSRQIERGARASFQLQVRGIRGQQAMTVEARKIDGAWHLEELRDIQITLAPAESVTMVTR